MTRFPAVVLLAVVFAGLGLPNAVAGPMTKSQARAIQKSNKKQQKAMKKYAKAQKKAQQKMIKKDRKNTHLPSHY